MTAFLMANSLFSPAQSKKSILAYHIAIDRKDMNNLNLQIIPLQRIFLLHNMTDTRPTIIAIMGPTASGKTAAALDIAQKIPSEIISVDSALVYREMDIGTAKPSQEELASVPHHLIDVVEPNDFFSMRDFQRLAYEAIDGILRVRLLSK